MACHSKMRAFTLIEMIVVIAIVAIVGTALSQIIQYFYRTNDYVLQEQQAVANARQGLTIAMQNLREASYGDDGSYPISSAATSSMVFYADITGTGDVQEVNYILKSGTLYRDVTYATGTPPAYTGSESTSTIATYVVNGTSTPIFQYYDDSGNLLSYPITLSSVSYITTDLQIDVDTKRTPSTYTLLGSATLRNLRTDE